MSAQSATLAGRAAAERLMVDTCTVTRVTGGSGDPETGIYTPTRATVYTGKCRVQQAPIARAGSRSEVGEASVVQVGYILQLPTSVTGVEVEDIATVTASALDSGLVGRSFRVAGQAAKTHATMRRLEIREVDS
jgi:hypothetical protein